MQDTRIHHARDNSAKAKHCVAGQLSPLLRQLASLIGDRGVIHLVDGNNQLGHPQRLGQLGMLPRLPAALKAGLKLALQAGTELHTTCQLLCGKLV